MADFNSGGIQIPQNAHEMFFPAGLGREIFGTTEPEQRHILTLNALPSWP